MVMHHQNSNPKLLFVHANSYMGNFVYVDGKSCIFSESSEMNPDAMNSYHV